MMQVVMCRKPNLGVQTVLPSFGCLLVDAEDLALFNAKCGAVSLLVGFY